MSDSDIQREEAARGWEAKLYKEVIHAIAHPDSGIFCSVNFLVAEGVVFFLNVPWMHSLPGDPRVVFAKLKAAGIKNVSCELIEARDTGHILHMAMSAAVEYAIGWYDGGLRIKLDDEQYLPIVSKAVRSLRENLAADKERKRAEQAEADLKKENENEDAINSISSALFDDSDITYVIIAMKEELTDGNVDTSYVFCYSEEEANRSFIQKLEEIKKETNQANIEVADWCKSQPDGGKSQIDEFGLSEYFWICSLLKIPAKLETEDDFEDLVNNYIDERDEESDSGDDEEVFEAYNEKFRRFVIQEECDENLELIWVDRLLQL